MTELKNAKPEEADVRQWVVAHIAELVDRPPEEIGQDTPLDALGLESVDAVLIGGALEERFDIEVDATLFLRNSSIDAIITDLRRAGILR